MTSPAACHISRLFWAIFWLLAAACAAPWKPEKPLRPPLGPDGNPCVHDVEGQVRKLFGRRAERARATWQLAWPEAYLPVALSPHEVMVRRGLFSTTHIQGFTRTYSHAFPLVASHSDDHTGALLLVGERRGELSLARIHGFRAPHPSGVHVIGRYVAAVDGDALTFVDTRDGTFAARTSLPPPALHGGGGGLGLARLADGSFLVMISRPGHFLPGPRATYFYRMVGEPRDPDELAYLGAEVYVQPRDWPGDQRFSENVSLVTECGSGRLFSAHTTGSDRLMGHGYLRLSWVDLSQRPPRLVPRALYRMRQHQAYCHFRSAATLFAREDHGVELVCHERAVHRGLGVLERQRFRFEIIGAGE